MSKKSKIEWTEVTWNPVTGCSKISEGCRNCYAERMTRRLQAMGLEAYQGLLDSKGHFTGRLNLIVKALNEPLKQKKPAIIFVNSMGDLFHERVPFAYIDLVFETIRKCPKHIFQILTKRPQRALQYLLNKEPLPNVWLGVSVEKKDYRHRINILRAIPAAVRFISFEPLIGDICLFNTSGIDWVIAGGETGPGARPMHPYWVRNIRDICEVAGIPFFFKQWGQWVEENKSKIGNQKSKTKDGKERIVLHPNGKINRHPETVSPSHFEMYGAVTMVKTGRRAAGNKLDGKVWQQMPRQEGYYE